MSADPSFIDRVRPFLRNNTFFGGLPDAALDALIRRGHTKKFARGDVICRRGEAGDSVMRELIEVIKANPGKYSFAAPGVGSTPHLSGEIFRLANDLDLPTVQFAGAGPAIQSTVGGHTPVAFSAVPPAAPQIQQGLLRGLAVTAATRSKALPDVPTMAEAGIPGQEAYTLTGMLAPAGTPKAIIDQLHQEIVTLVALPDVQARLDDLGFEVVANSPDEFAARIKVEMAKWAKVIRDANIKPEAAK